MHFGIVRVYRFLRATVRIRTSTISWDSRVLRKEEKLIKNKHKMQCRRRAVTDMRDLTAWTRAEKCVVKRFRRCANVIECTYTNLDSTV